MLKVHPSINQCLINAASSGYSNNISVCFFDYICSSFANYNQLILDFNTVDMTCHFFLCCSFVSCFPL